MAMLSVGRSSGCLCFRDLLRPVLATRLLPKPDVLTADEEEGELAACVHMDPLGQAFLNGAGRLLLGFFRC